MDININISKTHVFAETFLKKRRGVKLSSGTLVFHFSASSLLVLFADGPDDEPRVKSYLRLDTHATQPGPDRTKALADYVSSLGLRSPRVIAVASEGVTLRQLEMPAMPDADLKQAAAWELKKKFFLNPEDQLVGILGIYDFDGPEGPEKLINVFHVEKKPSLARLSILSSLNLQIHAFWPGPAALSRLAAAQAGKEEAAADLLVVDITGSTLRISAVQKGVTMLSRVASTGVAGQTLPENAYDRVAGEIERSIEFYETQKFARPVSHVVLVGTGYDAEALSAFLTPKIPQKISTIDGSRYVSDDLSEEQKTLLVAQPGLFAEALGAMAVHEEALNLIPDEIHTHNRRYQIDRSMRKMFLAVVSAFAFWIVWLFVQAQIISAQVGYVEKEWMSIETGKSAFTEVISVEKHRRTAMKGAIDLPGLLKELSRLTPSPIMLQSVGFSREDGTFQLSGVSQDSGNENVRLITQYVNNLSASPFFTSVTLGQTMEEEGDGRTKFQIDAVVKAAL